MKQVEEHQLYVHTQRVLYPPVETFMNSTYLIFSGQSCTFGRTLVGHTQK
jgi:hypothetical protein